MTQAQHISPIQPATKLRRVAATLIDALITAALVVFATLASGQFEVAAPYLDGTLVLRAAALVIGSYLLLHGVFLFRSGQTIGKKILGLQIVTGNHPAPFWRLLIRAGTLLSLAFIPVVGYALQALHLVDIVLFLLPAGLALHDRISGTQAISLALGEKSKRITPQTDG